MNDKIIELGKKVLNLESEIQKNIEILASYKKQIAQMLEGKNDIEIASKSSKIKVIKEIKTITKFNSKEFNKAHKDEYQECRKTSLRFDQKLAKKKYPELFKKFEETTTSEIIRIESYQPDLGLDDLPEF